MVKNKKIYEDEISRLKSKLFQNQFYDRISDLIPGIVHNITNPLTIISMKVQLQQRKNPGVKDFGIIASNCKRINTILNNLLYI